MFQSLSAGSLHSTSMPITIKARPRSLSPSALRILPQALYKFTEHENFMAQIKTLAISQKATEKTWHNNNSTIKQNAYVIDLKNLRNQPAKIIKELFALKQKYKDQTVVAVPVAGYGHKPKSLLDNTKETLEKEYAQSFSLAALTTAKNTATEQSPSIVLRASKKSHKMEIFQEGDQHFLSVSAGVRITDIDQFLFNEGFALPPNMPTLHVASLVGAAANGCYGPARDLPSMTTNIVEMKIINAKGEHLTLSARENPKLFELLRDGHLGVCFVSEITVKIEPKFHMERHNMLFNDVNALKARMEKENLIDKEHFVAMYIPVDINAKEGEHAPRIRITNLARAEDRPHLEVETQQQKDLLDYLSLKLTDAGEPIIDIVTKHPKLRKFWPFLLESAALKTYGKEKDTFEIGNSATMLHLFGTYTELPIRDINWLIQVDDTEDAKKLFLELFELTEKKLIELGKDKHYPLLNAFSRYLKGICYPEGKGGIAATAVEKEGQGVLSFELVTYAPLAHTKEYEELEKEITGFLDKANRKYNFHPGKHMPDNITSLTQIIKETDVAGRQRIENFKKAIYELHGGKENVPYSPFLTPQKKVFIGLDPSIVEEHVELNMNRYEEQHIKSALNIILDIAKENEDRNATVIQQASKHLAKVAKVT